MKTLNKLFIAALATTAMTACNNDLNNNSLNSDRTVNFTMGIGETVSSRISMNDGEYTAKFSPNNSVGIFVKDQGSYKNLKYTTTDGTTWDGPQINLTEGGTYTYYAYYPYSSEVDAADAIAINVATDQETGGYLANDYLYCNKQSAETNVALEYKHALSLVDVTLAGDAIGENATVSIINVATDATLNVTAPSVTTGSTHGDVKMDVLTNTKNFRAIIPAQTIAASTPIFRIENEGRTYEAKYSGEISFAEGKYLALTITIGEADGEPTININVSGSISDWTEDSNAGGDVSIAATAINVPLPTDGTFTEIKNTWQNEKIPATNTEGWYTRSSSAEGKRVEHSYDGTTEHAILLNAITWTESSTEGSETTTNYTVGSWSNNNIVYHSTSPLEAGAYLVSFKVKSNIDNGIIGVLATSSNDDKVFAMYNTSGVFWQRSVTSYNQIKSDAYVEKSFIINLNQYSTDGIAGNNLTYSSLLNSEESDYANGLNLIFYNYTCNSNKVANKLYLKDIKIAKTDIELKETEDTQQQ